MAALSHRSHAARLAGLPTQLQLSVLIFAQPSAHTPGWLQPAQNNTPIVALMVRRRPCSADAALREMQNWA